MALEVSTVFDDEKKIWKSKVSGEVDIYSQAELKESLSHCYEDESKISDLEIDLSNLDYIDSTGLGILIGVLKRLKLKEKNVYLINLKDNIKKLFLITGLDKIFNLEGNIGSN